MLNLWSDEAAAACRSELALRVYTSRLLGRDKSLVLHGGGNTSVKIRERNLVGEDEDILYVKGSGWDLEFIEEAGFSPVRLAHLQKLSRLQSLTDPDMVNELVTHMTRASAPAPSVETILHALLPYRYVDHTHADAVLTVTNTPDGVKRIRELYGDSVVVIPYVMPGFDLARLCAQKFPAESGPRTIGMVLMNHGIFSFGNTARESYDRMIHLVSAAETYLARNKADLPRATATPNAESFRSGLAALRRDISSVAGFPLVMRRNGDARCLSFARRNDLTELVSQGPATPDHVLRTKRTPMVGRDAGAYASGYAHYFETNARRTPQPKTMLDPAPRLVVDPELGMLALGRSARDAGVASELYLHTMDIMERSAALGGYKALPAGDIFDVEYWDLEQAKLKRAGKAPALAGEVALVTGAASGIGRACVSALLARGAAVIGLDRQADVSGMHQRPDYLGIACDVTKPDAVCAALEQGVAAYGGVDLLILNAGVFPGSTPVAALDPATWRSVMDVNVDANANLLKECHALLKLAPRGGRVVVVGSRNVPAPGPGAAAYSASKAALVQLARVAALEWGADGIRVNILHPDAVFDTGIWTDEVLAARAAHYGISVEAYKKRNVLKTEITSADVAELAAEMCGPLFARTTGAQVPVDGGNERVI